MKKLFTAAAIVSMVVGTASATFAGGLDAVADDSVFAPEDDDEGLLAGSLSSGALIGVAAVALLAVAASSDSDDAVTTTAGSATN